MGNVIVMERSIREVLMRPEKSNIKEESKLESGLNRIKRHHKRSRIKFYRAEAYPVASGLMVGF